MNKFLKGECVECGGHIEFPAEATGTTVDCPHCGKATELILCVPKSGPLIPRKTLVYTAIAVVILVGGLIAAQIAVKRAERMVGHKPSGKESPQAPPAPNPFAAAGFEASAVTVEKNDGSALVYATGTIRNLGSQARYGVRVELDLLDEHGGKVGAAKDYKDVIEPKGEWRFRAQILEKRAVGAKVTSIKDDQDK